MGILILNKQQNPTTRMKNSYKVTYQVRTAEDCHGEFSHKQKIREYTLESVTNDLNELFTDLFDKYRQDGLIGIEIIAVEPSCGNCFTSKNLDFKKLTFV